MEGKAAVELTDRGRERDSERDSEDSLRNRQSGREGRGRTDRD